MTILETESSVMETVEATVPTRVVPVRALPNGMPRRLRKLWLLVPGGIALVLIALILLPPKGPDDTVVQDDSPR